MSPESGYRFRDKDMRQIKAYCVSRESRYGVGSAVCGQRVAHFEGYTQDNDATKAASMDAVQHHRETVQPIREKTGAPPSRTPRAARPGRRSTRPAAAASLFDVVFRDRKTGAKAAIRDLRLPMPGRHNVSNATAAIA